MTYGDNYALAKKMKDRFSGMGSGVSGMQASSTSELMDRAQREHNPHGNAAEAAFRENYRKHTGAAPEPQIRYHTTEQSPRPRRTTQTPPPRSERTKNTSPRQGSRNKKSTEPKIVRPEPIIPAVEEAAEKKPFPKMFLVMVLLGALIFLALVSGISEVYQTRREIAGLEKQLEQLEETAQQLELRLEDKNDVKTIEAMAKERLGMVKEEYVQKEYISLSDGERIELIEGSEEESAGGIMLSSVFSALGDFFERFK